MWNKIVFELKLYELAHKTYDLFSKEMQRYLKSMPAPWLQTARNGYIITRVFFQLNSNKDQKIFYTQANEFI